MRFVYGFSLLLLGLVLAGLAWNGGTPAPTGDPAAAPSRTAPPRAAPPRTAAPEARRLRGEDAQEPTTATLAGRQGAPSLPIAQDATHALRVLVKGPDGAPVGGATVTLFTWRAPTGTWGSERASPRTTQADGVVLFEGLPDEPLTVLAEAPGFSSRGLLWFASTPATPAAQVTAVLTRVPQAISGVVSDAETGDPVAGVRITSFVDRGPDDTPPHVFDVRGPRAESTSDARGRWRLPDMDSVLRFSAPGYETLWLQAFGAGHPEPLDVALRRGVTLCGVVVDRAGAPLVGARVAARMLGYCTVRDLPEGISATESPKDAFLYTGSGSLLEAPLHAADPNAAWSATLMSHIPVHTGEDGTWAIPGVPVGAHVLVDAQHPALPFDVARRVVVTKEGASIRLAPEPRETLTVIALRVGQPPRYVPEVEVRLKQGPRTWRKRGHGRGIVMDGLIPGTYEVEVWARGVRQGRRTGVVGAGQRNVAVVPMDLSPGEVPLGSLALEGRVRDDSGAPVSGARVSARVTGEAVRADELGRFRLAHHPDLQPTLLVEAPGHIPWRKTVWAWCEGKSVDVRLDRGYRFAVELEPAPPAGADITFVRCNSSGEEEPSQGIELPTEGRMQSPWIAERDQGVALLVAGYAPVFLPQLPRDAADRAWRASLDVGMRVRVQVLAGGRPAAGVVVHASARWLALDPWGQEPTNEEGEAWIRHVPRGEPLSVLALRAGSGTGGYRGVPREGQPLVIELREPATLTGRVRDPGGVPLPGVLIRAKRWTPDGGVAEARVRSDSAGRYRLVLGGGPYDVSLRALEHGTSGEELGRMKVTLASGEHVSRDITVKRPEDLR